MVEMEASRRIQLVIVLLGCFVADSLGKYCDPQGNPSTRPLDMAAFTGGRQGIKWAIFQWAEDNQFLIASDNYVHYQCDSQRNSQQACHGDACCWWEDDEVYQTRQCVSTTTSCFRLVLFDDSSQSAKDSTHAIPRQQRPLSINVSLSDTPILINHHFNRSPSFDSVIFGDKQTTNCTPCDAEDEALLEFYIQRHPRQQQLTWSLQDVAVLDNTFQANIPTNQSSLQYFAKCVKRDTRWKFSLSPRESSSNLQEHVFFRLVYDNAIYSDKAISFSTKNKNATNDIATTSEEVILLGSSQGSPPLACPSPDHALVDLEFLVFNTLDNRSFYPIDWFVSLGRGRDDSNVVTTSKQISTNYLTDTIYRHSICIPRDSGDNDETCWFMKVSMDDMQDAMAQYKVAVDGVYQTDVSLEIIFNRSKEKPELYEITPLVGNCEATTSIRQHRSAGELALFIIFCILAPLVCIFGVILLCSHSTRSDGQTVTDETDIDDDDSYEMDDVDFGHDIVESFEDMQAIKDYTSQINPAVGDT